MRRSLILGLLVAMALLSCPTEGWTAGGKNKTTKEPVAAATAPSANRSGHFCRKYAMNKPKVVLLGIDRSINTPRPIDQTGLILADDMRQTLLKDGERLVVFTLYDHPSSKAVLFDDCRPTQETCLLCERKNPNEVEADQKVFETSVSAAIATAKTWLPATRQGNQNASQSAIVSTFAAITHGLRPSPIKALVAMTDLIDSESLGLSPPPLQIAANESDSKIKALKSAGAIPYLPGAEIWIYGIGRSDRDKYDPIPTPSLHDILLLWRRIFRAAGADDADIHLIQ